MKRAQMTSKPQRAEQKQSRDDDDDDDDDGLGLFSTETVPKTEPEDRRSSFRTGP